MNILGLQKLTLLDYPQHVASTIFTGGCNFRCPYCHNGDLVLHGDTMEAFSEEEVFEHLHKRGHMLTGICITGGEPTIQPDLYDFIVKLRQFHLPIKLDTNGSASGFLNQLVHDGLIDYVAMDIKHCPDKYDTIVNRPDFNIEDIYASVEFLKKGLIDYEFRTTIAKELHSKEDIIAIGQWLSGAKQYYLQPYKESEEVINPIYSSYSKEELESFVTILQKDIPIVAIRGMD